MRTMVLSETRHTAHVKRRRRELRLHEDWYTFRERGYERIAVDWCVAHGIGYEPLRVSNDADP